MKGARAGECVKSASEENLPWLGLHRCSLGPISGCIPWGLSETSMALGSGNRDWLPPEELGWVACNCAGAIAPEQESRRGGGDCMDVSEIGPLCGRLRLDRGLRQGMKE